MNYELALELKDAGFPQESNIVCHYRNPSTGEIGGGNMAYPTLEELIEACGEEFYRLVNFNGESDATWHAEAHEFKGGKTGKTPSIAVARLWLALNNNAI